MILMIEGRGAARAAQKWAQKNARCMAVNSFGSVEICRARGAGVAKEGLGGAAEGRTWREAEGEKHVMEAYQHFVICRRCGTQTTRSMLWKLEQSCQGVTSAVWKGNVG